MPFRSLWCRVVQLNVSRLRKPKICQNEETLPVEEKYQTEVNSVQTALFFYSVSVVSLELKLRRRRVWDKTGVFASEPAFRSMSCYPSLCWMWVLCCISGSLGGKRQNQAKLTAHGFSIGVVTNYSCSTRTWGFLCWRRRCDDVGGCDGRLVASLWKICL